MSQSKPIPSGAFILIGSGPGIGRSTATLFATNGFNHLVLLSRNKDRLLEDAEAVRKANPDAKVETLQIDLAESQENVKKVLGEVDEVLKSWGVQVEVVMYNAARVGPSKFFEWDVKDLEADLRITTVSLYTTLQWCTPLLLSTSTSQSSSKTSSPTILIPSGGLYKQPYPFLFSLSAAKASQHNLVTSYHKKFGDQINVKIVPISGVVSEDVEVTTPGKVAGMFWVLFEKGKGGEVSVEMNDPAYEGMVEGMRRQVEGE